MDDEPAFTFRDDRGGPSLPSIENIARHWGRPAGACFGCGKITRWLERAHIVDRFYNGLDGPQNLALLCRPCHLYYDRLDHTPDIADRCLELLGLTDG